MTRTSTPALQRPTGETVIEAVAVCKAYRRGTNVVHVLDGVDLEVRRGECLFLVGPSGSGKSTLLSILGCLLSPDCGRLSLLGQEVSRLDERTRVALRRDRIGFVFQRFQLIRGLTAIENVTVPLILRGDGERAARRRAAMLLDTVGLHDHLHADTRNLSAGQCQRVALARSLACDPELILADEPTASLDAQSGLEAVKLLRHLIRAEGKTAVVVTHDQRIIPYADRICFLQGKRLAQQSSFADQPLPSGVEGLA